MNHRSVAHVEHFSRIFTFLREFSLSARDKLIGHGQYKLVLLNHRKEAIKRRTEMNWEHE